MMDRGRFLLTSLAGALAAPLVAEALRVLRGERPQGLVNPDGRASGSADPC